MIGISFLSYSISLQANCSQSDPHCNLKQSVNEVFTAKNCNQIKVKGDCNFFSILKEQTLYNSKLKINVVTNTRGVIKKGRFIISSKAVAPVDPVTGLVFVCRARVLQVRTFAGYPDIVALYGIVDSNPNQNYTILPLEHYPPETNREFSIANNEIVGLIRPGQRTGFLTTFENQNLDVANPNPEGNPLEINGVPIAQAFCHASIEDLLTLVGGFQDVQQFGFLKISTTEKPICLP